MNAKLKLAAVEDSDSVVEPSEPAPRELLLEAHARVKAAELTLSRVRSKRASAAEARWNAKQAAARAGKAATAASVLNPDAILAAMQAGADDPTAQPAAGRAQAQATAAEAEEAFAEAQRHLAIWETVTTQAEAELAKARGSYELRTGAVLQPIREAIDARIRDELEQHRHLLQRYSVFANDLMRDPNAEAPV